MRAQRHHIIWLALIAIAVAGCGGKPQKVPNVTGERLDYAEATLEARGLSYEVHGGGKLGVIVSSNWWVCSQDPAAGKMAKSVGLVVARTCEETKGVPNVVGLNLHRARETLEAFGADVWVDPYYDEEDEEEPIVVERLWTVCDQSNSHVGGQWSVGLYVERWSCS